MFKFSIDIQGLFIDIKLRKSKWLLLATYKPPSLSNHDYFNHVGKALDFYGVKYKNVIIMGDLNILDSEEVLSDFLEERKLSNLVNFPTCFKSDTNPSVIDLIITNEQKSFPNTIGISTGLSDFHGMVLTSMKTTFPKAAPKVMTYNRNIKNLMGHHSKPTSKIAYKMLIYQMFKALKIFSRKY